MARGLCMDVQIAIGRSSTLRREFRRPLRQFAQRGHILRPEQLALILIEHDFEFVKRISTRIVVLVAGKLLADGTVTEIANSTIVREAYLGRSYKEQVA